MMWIVGLLIAVSGGVGGVIVSTRAGEADVRTKNYAISRGSVVVIIGMVLMFAGTPVLEGQLARTYLGIDVIVAVLLAALLVVHFSVDEATLQEDKPGA